MKNKILLIESPFYRLHKNSYSLDRIPFGLAYLAGSILENTNWDVKVYNADFIPSINRKKVSFLAGRGFNSYVKNLNNLNFGIWNEIRKVIMDFKPNVIGISVKSATYISSVNISKIAKQIDANIKIIFGGPYPTSAKKDLFINPNLDISVIGEGENTIAELLYSIKADLPLNNINGLIFRQNNELVSTPPREFMKDLNVLPYPHEIAKRVLHDYKKYPKSAFKYIFASRGCPFNCNFCASKDMWTRKARLRSVENIVNEIKGITKLGIKNLHFDDDTFGISKKNILNLCNSIKTEVPDIKWSCEIRADIIDDDIVIAMKEAGCELIQIGFESGNDKILEYMSKGVTVSQILNACRIVKKHSIELQTFFLVGYPYETEETLKDSIKMMKKSKSDKIIYSIFTPYPYTYLYEFCKEKGLVKEKFDPTLFNHQSPLNCFSMYIPPKRFRVLAKRIERMVDRRNLILRMKRILTLKGFQRFNELTNETMIKIKNQKESNCSSKIIVDPIEITELSK
ncbi:MAG: radical SAM protein [Melioribacteraceae bacterium]